MRIAPLSRAQMSFLLDCSDKHRRNYRERAEGGVEHILILFCIALGSAVVVIVGHPPGKVRSLGYGIMTRSMLAYVLRKLIKIRVEFRFHTQRCVAENQFNLFC